MSQFRNSADVCLLVEDIGRSVGFYRDMLGFDLSQQNPTFAKFRAAGICLALWQSGTMVAHTGLAEVSLSAGARGFIGLPMDSPEQVDRLHDRLSASNVSIEVPPRDFPWGARCCFFRDPDAHLWEIYAWAESRDSMPLNKNSG